jgi:biopolymer transport protein ExbB
MRIVEYITQGGPIMYILLLLNICGFAVMISKFFLFNKEVNKIEESANELNSKIDKVGKDTNSLLELAKQELSLYIGGLEKGLNTVKIIATISPLLGLLGTVIGVLVAFRVMSQTGLNNPASFAQGISMALITTVGGMMVAIPHYIGHSYLMGILDRVEIGLEKTLVGKVL